MDFEATAKWAVHVVAFLVFNAPIVIIALGLRVTDRLGDALREKDVSGAVDGGPSYSRVTGALGAVIVTSFFWAVGNLILLRSLNGESIRNLVDSVMPFFAVGAALFLPYAFNQIRAMIRPRAGDEAAPEPSPPPPPPRSLAGKVLPPATRNLPPADAR